MGGQYGPSNTPAKGLTACFPPAPRGTYEPFSTVCARIKAGVYKGKQVDWGAWAAVVTKPDITTLVDELYGTDPTYCGLKHLCQKLAELRAAVPALPEDSRFAVVAEEF